MQVQEEEQKGEKPLSGQKDMDTLSSVPKHRWDEIRAMLPKILEEIGPGAPDQLVHLPKTAPVELIVAHLHRDGGVILDELVGPALCDAVVREMQPYLDDTKFDQLGDEDFGGVGTKRALSVPVRSETACDLLGHQLIMDVCAGVLGYQLLREVGPGHRLVHGKEQPFELSANAIIQIWPGEKPQQLHRDRYTFVADGAFEVANIEPYLTVMWALDDWTRHGVGVTRMVPGSHKWDDETANAFRSQNDAAEIKDQGRMPKGSAMLWTGSTLHGGGGNVTKTETRTGYTCAYHLAWLRQEENQYLSCPPHLAKDLPVRIQKLLGYTLGGNGLGFYGDLKRPEDALKPDRLRLEAVEEIDWAKKTAKTSRL